jgi:hypothetical protein
MGGKHTGPMMSGKGGVQDRLRWSVVQMHLGRVHSSF